MGLTQGDRLGSPCCLSSAAQSCAFGSLDLLVWICSSLSKLFATSYAESALQLAGGSTETSLVVLLHQSSVLCSCDLAHLKRGLSISGEPFLISCRGRRIALDIIAGLTYLHQKEIVHLDLKSPNVSVLNLAKPRLHV